MDRFTRTADVIKAYYNYKKQKILQHLSKKFAASLTI